MELEKSLFQIEDYMNEKQLTCNVHSWLWSSVGLYIRSTCNTRARREFVVPAAAAVGRGGAPGELREERWAGRDVRLARRRVLLCRQAAAAAAATHRAARPRLPACRHAHATYPTIFTSHNITPNNSSHKIRK